jgi:outer membrane protein assembly factor BamA
MSFLETGAAGLVDLRDTAFNPRRGGFLGVSFERRTALGEEPLVFHRASLDARAYLPLGSPSRVLALSFLGSFDDTISGDAVPFYLQSTLGDSSTLRGFPLRRFRGENWIHFSIEYRWEAAPALELALFYDAGQVASSLSGLRIDDLEGSFGFGVRFKTSSSVFLRLDIATSHEATRYHIASGHPF